MEQCQHTNTGKLFWGEGHLLLGCIMTFKGLCVCVGERGTDGQR